MTLQPSQSRTPRPPYLHSDGEYISIGFGNGPDTLLKVGGQTGPAGEVDRERAALWVEQQTPSAADAAEWLRSDEWQNGGSDATWAYYAAEFAEEIERRFYGESKHDPPLPTQSDRTGGAH